MTALAPAGRPSVGVDVVAPRALDRVVRAVVRDVLQVPLDRISIRLSDAGGGLAVTVEAAIRPPDPDADLLGELHAARSRVVEQIGRIAERAVSRVDLRVTGLVLPPAERVLR